MVKLIWHNPDLLVEDFLRLKYLGPYAKGQFKDFLIQNGYKHLPTIYFSIIFKTDKDGNLIEINTDVYSDNRHSYYNDKDFAEQNSNGENLYSCLINFMKSKGYPFKSKMVGQDEIIQFINALRKEGFQNFDTFFQFENS